MSASRLSALDAAFLAIESEDAPMHVGWAALFTPPADGPAPSFEAIREHIAGRLHRAPRYRQRLARVPLGLGDPVWVDDPSFDIDSTCCARDHGDFQQLVNEVMSHPLQHDRALWELWIASSTTAGSPSPARRTTASSTGSRRWSSWRSCSTRRPSPSRRRRDLDGWTATRAAERRDDGRRCRGARAGELLALARMPLGWLRDPSTLRDVPAQAWRVAQAVLHTAQPLAPPSSRSTAR